MCVGGGGGGGGGVGEGVVGGGRWRGGARRPLLPVAYSRRA